MTKDKSTLRVLAVMESTTVSGPAKNLIEFARRARSPRQAAPDLPPVEVSIATFHRAPSAAHGPAHDDRHAAETQEDAPNAFVAAARAAGIAVDVMAERFRFDPRVVAQLREIVGRRKPDIIQTHQIKSHFLVKLSGLWKQYPWIAVHHGYTSTDLKMLFYNQLNRWSLPTAHRVVTVCGAFARQLEREGVRPERISVRHNSVSAAPHDAGRAEEETRLLRARYDVADGERVVVAIGRLSREKAHVDLIAALGHMRRARPDIDFKLLIVGDGPERANVESAAVGEGVTDRVVFVGHVADVRPFYAAADVMALPSHSEGSPNVLLEAMAAGVPSVATTVGGVPEIAAHEETALLVAPRDPEAMATQLARLLTDARLASELSANASSVVAARYSPEAYARSVAEMYRELAPGRRHTTPGVRRRPRPRRRRQTTPHEAEVSVIIRSTIRSLRRPRPPLGRVADFRGLRADRRGRRLQRRRASSRSSWTRACVSSGSRIPGRVRRAIAASPSRGRIPRLLDADDEGCPIPLREFAPAGKKSGESSAELSARVGRRA
jgi:glycosyltransferase involved in cell wall biosynthesis